MHARRRKKRAQYGAGAGAPDVAGARTVALRRGDSGFGFTISGQQPCILSCIVPGSNADLAGLRAGNFLISVNGVNVSKAPHDTVVQLIGNALGAIDMSVAESYYSDSSEEECASARVPAGARVRPKHVHKMKTRPVKSHQLMRSSRSCNAEREDTCHGHQSSKCSEERCSILAGPRMPRIMNNLSNIRALIGQSVASGNMVEPSFSHISNVDDYHNMPSTSSARNNNYESSISLSSHSHKSVQQPHMERESPIECRVIIGYLGTIEMPKQIATSSKLQTVRSCIRKLRQEKRSSTTVLMTVHPSSMTLKNCQGVLLAEYACRRINYVSCMSENDYRYFGLVTAATHIDTNENNIFSNETEDGAVTVEISHSCHVFTIDPKLIEHASHALKASEFRIMCTLDPVTDHCLEFPTSAEYIVNIIRLMYSLKFPNGFSGKTLENLSKFTLKSSSPVAGSNFSRRAPLLRGPRYDRGPRRNPRRQNGRYDNMAHVLHVENLRPNVNVFMANSPQPSNHSEITTTSSNSDSGIGFHNDCQNISDRIVVVDFANPPSNFNMHAQQHIQNHYEPSVRNVSTSKDNKRPLGISGAGSFDTDSSFLSNTTPVVEGFGGQGQPLNRIENEILPIGDIPQSVFNANVLNISKRSITSEDRVKEKCSPCYFGYADVDCDRLNVRAFIGNHNYARVPDGLTNIKCHYQDDSSTSCSSASKYQNVGDDMHYDPVYTEPEDHHYEMIKPNQDGTDLDEHFRFLNLYVDCYPENCAGRSEEVVQASLRFNDTESVDDMTVVSTKSCDYIHDRQVSIDDISTYSTRSHENPYKVKHHLKSQSSVDDILMLGLNGNAPNETEHTFLRPANVKGKLRKRFKVLSKTKQILNRRDDKKLERDKKSSKEALEYKLSPKVFDVSRPCASVDDLCDERAAARGCSDSEEGGGWWGGAPLEGTRSEPDLRSPQRTQPPDQDSESEQSSPFRRWTSNGGSAAALGHRSYRRPGSLVASSDHDMYSKCADGGGARGSSEAGGAGCAGGVSRWSLGLEHLLADPAGASAFAAFLAQEFSAENIRFWWACERYRTASAGAERAALAGELWARHLAEGAPEPVNVDAHARQAAHRALHDAPQDLFAQAQKQIFNLMKFDSYPRFLRSDVHAQCARAELRGQPPPYPAPAQNAATPTKLKKSLSNAEERRRGSLLTWARLRGGSKERPSPQPAAQPPAQPKADDRREDCSRRPSISSSVIRAGCVLCRVVLPDAATSIVAVDDSSIRQVVDRLLEKRAIRCSAYDVIVQGESRPLDVTAASATLGGKEVAVERRVVFRLELPSRRVVSVRTRPGKPLAAVLRPALDRYAHARADVAVTRAGEPVPLDTDVQEVDGARLQVLLTQPSQKPVRTRADEPAGQQAGKPGGQSLDEITNRVFEEVLQGKAELQAPPTDNSMKSESCSSERSSCARRGGRSVVAKLRAGVHLQSAALDSNEFLENLRQTQRARLAKPEVNGLSRSPTEAAEATPPVPAARHLTRPRPAVRTSLGNKSPPADSADQSTDKLCESIAGVSTASGEDAAVAKTSEPPPLPPKPKVLPTKPPNWGNSLPDSSLMQDVNLPMNIIDEMKVRNTRMIYLDQPTSSFV